LICRRTEIVTELKNPFTRSDRALYSTFPWEGCATNPFPDNPRAVLGYLSQGAFICVCSGGLVAILGCLTGNPTFTHLTTLSPPERLNSAVLHFLTGGAFLLGMRGHRRIPQAIGLFTLGFAGLSIVQYLFCINLKIDALIPPHFLDHDSYPGRMSLNSSINFFLLGTALILPRLNGRWTDSGFIASLLGSVIFAIGLSSLFGLLTGVEGAATWGRYNGMPLQGALSFLLGGIAINLLVWGKEDQRNHFFPRWSPFPAAFAISTISLILWNALLADQRKHFVQSVSSELVQVENEISDRLQTQFMALTRMVKRWEAVGKIPSQHLWELNTKLLIDHYPGFKALTWIDAKKHPIWEVAEPNFSFSRLEPALPQTVRQTLSEVSHSHHMEISQAFPTTEGNYEFVAATPIYFGSRFIGSLMITYDVSSLFDRVLHSQVSPGYALGVYQGNELLYSRGSSEASFSSEWTRELGMNFFGRTWRIRGCPTPATLSEMSSSLPEVTLIMGLVMALLVSGLIYLFRETYLRSHRLSIEIAHRRIAEQELKVLNETLENRVLKKTSEITKLVEDLGRSNRDLEQFAYIASHDLQEPLRTIASYLTLLSVRFQGHLDQDARDFIDFAVSGAIRLKHLIDALLDYSRVGRVQLRLEPADCQEIVRDVKDSLKIACDESQARIEVGPLPKIMADRTQLMQVFQNLIGNALKFHGNRAPTVRVSAELVDAEWVFSVIDNGIGIAPQHLERIFHIFNRVHSRAQYPGSGIGLAVCKRIVERHGGRIWVRSTYHEGSRFNFSLPYHPEDEPGNEFDGERVPPPLQDMGQSLRDAGYEML
jgi:signal transduction histidine kinase